MWAALTEYRSVTSDISASILASRLSALFVFMTIPFFTFDSAVDFAGTLDVKLACAFRRWPFRIFAAADSSKSSSALPAARIPNREATACHIAPACHRRHAAPFPRYSISSLNRSGPARFDEFQMRSEGAAIPADVLRFRHGSSLGGGWLLRLGPPGIFAYHLGRGRLNRAACRPSCLVDRSRKPKPRVLLLAPLRIPPLWCRARRFACSARKPRDICSSCSRSPGIPRPTR